MLNGIKSLKYRGDGGFLLIAGPLIIENKTSPLKIAEELAEVANTLKIPLIFKAAFKRINSALNEEFSGIGNEPALKLLKEISYKLKIPVQTDIYSEMDAFVAEKYVDILQIPAFLFRDTDLLHAAAKTGKYINIRKSTTSFGDDMSQAVAKVRRTGYNNILLTERGTMMGYHDVVVDYRNIPLMKRNNTPVILDISSAMASQMTGTKWSVKRSAAMNLAKAGFATGIDGIAIDTHNKPDFAKSSETWYLPTDKLHDFLKELQGFYYALKGERI